MEQRQLELFIAVAEELNFTRAARRKNAVQSTVSASVRALERELGTTLFDRTTSRVSLTAAGRALLPKAKSAMDSLQAAQAAVKETEGGLRGNLRVGTLAGVTTVDLLALVAAFRTRHPGVELHMAIASEGTAGLIERVKNHTLDVALVGVDTPRIDGLDVQPIAELQPRVIMSLDHPLAQRDSIRAADLAGEPFIDLPVGYCNRSRSDNTFRRAGVSRTIAVEVSDIGSIPSYVEAQLGVALVPPLMEDADSAIAALQLDPPAAPWTLAIATSSSATRTRALDAFVALVPEHTNIRGVF